MVTLDAAQRPGDRLGVAGVGVLLVVRAQSVVLGEDAPHLLQRHPRLGGHLLQLRPRKLIHGKV